MKKLRFFKLRDTVIMATQLKQLFRKRSQTAVTIQRIARGFLARRTLFEQKVWKYVMKRYYYYYHCYDYHHHFIMIVKICKNNSKEIPTLYAKEEKKELYFAIE